MKKTSDMWVEWIPNISTADMDIVGGVTQLFEEIEDLFLLHTDPGLEVNRTVFTVVGTRTSLRKALLGLMDLLEDKINMSMHQSSHPRVGALDVCPYVLLKNGTTNDLLTWVRRLAKEVSHKYTLPVYLYESSALNPNRKNLADIRRGEYEGLKMKMKDPRWKPDYGSEFNPRLGATIMGVRDFLIAYNVNLDTVDVSIAKRIANQIRTKGKPGRKYKLPGVKAIGWLLKESGFCQVSTNIIQTRTTTLRDVYSHCQILSREYGCQVTGSELIGLLPSHAVTKMLTQHFFSTATLANDLGLGYCGITDLKERIIEQKTYIASEGTIFKEMLNEFNP